MSGLVKGLIFALAACTIWGTSFVSPLYLESFTPIEVTVGRYFFYSIFSYLIFFKSRLKGLCRYPLWMWMRSGLLSGIGSVAYFLFFVMSLRYATPAITALIIGISPITIAFYANWKQQEVNFKNLILPSLLIFMGLVVINAPHIYESESPSSYAFGLFFGLMTLWSWTWFVVANARFLKDHPEVSSDDWSTLLGASIFFLVLGLGLIAGLFFEDHFDFSKFTVFDETLLTFALVCGSLGIINSWIGGYLWNKASFYLPISLAGQMTIFETIFGLCFVCLADQCLPPSFELLGIILMLTAIVYGIRVAAQLQAQPTTEHE